MGGVKYNAARALDVETKYITVYMPVGRPTDREVCARLCFARVQKQTACRCQNVRVQI